MATKRKKPVLNKKVLIGIGIASALIGTYFLAGDKIKSLFKKDDQSNDELNPPPNVLPPAPVINNASVPTIVTTPSVPKPDTIDINKKLRKGISNAKDEVIRLQFIINYIAGLRKTTSYKTPSGYVVKFPIKADGDFGNNTQAGAYFISPEFSKQGYITLDQARNKLAYVAGYYQKPFPSELVGTKNYNKYQESYKSGQIKFGQDDRAKKIGAFVNPFNP